MLGHLIRKEMQDHILSFRFLTLSALGSLVIWLSLFSGYTYYQGCLKDYRLSQTVTELHIQHHVETGWLGGAGQYGYPVQKPPTPMSVFVRGLDPTLGRTAHVAWLHIRRLKFSPTAERPLLGVFPPLDLAVVVQVILSLFILLLTYDAVCGEKEGGTLRLTSSFPVPRDRLLLSKVLGALIPILVTFGFPLLLGIGVILFLPDVRFQSPELVRLGLILGTFVLYMTTLTCVGILGSSLTHRAATSFVILLFFWAGTVIVLPRLSLVAADVLRPAPSTQQLLASQWELGNAHNQHRVDLLGQWVSEFSRKTGRQWWETPDGKEQYTLVSRKLVAEMLAKVNPDLKHLEDAFRNRYNARLELAALMARFSPAFALNNATVWLAGTGVERHRRFLEAYHLARDRLTDWNWEKQTQRGLSEANPQKHGNYVLNLSDIPRVSYQETWPGEEIHTALVDAGVLALWGLAFFVGAYVAMLRYDLR
jgi:ABC-type transport system involved in multi-copper enzyme maturation permease subunit